MTALRPDRLATLYLGSPLARRNRAAGTRIPILMYHAIAERGEEAHPYYETAVSPQNFAAQMRILHENGYRTVAPDEVWPETKVDVQGLTVAITFDDGYEDFLTQAFPVLQQYGFSATVYLATDYIGEERRHFQGKPCLTWAEVAALRRQGIRFGSHTASHPKLVEMTPENIARELNESKREIERRLNEPVTSFCYPFAFPSHRHDFCAGLRRQLEGSGYRNAVCTMIGRARPGDASFFLRRIPVTCGDDARLFRAKLEGGYDWAGVAQHWSKVLRAH